ncbi:MAG: amino acid ABC transporter permease, partial [Burkholderiaceae bacterium]
MSTTTLPPAASVLTRLRSQFFYSPGASIVTLLTAAVLGFIASRLIGWGVSDAVFAPDYQACRAAGGACWGFIAEKWRLILFGRYPFEEQWRPALAVAAIVAMLLVSAWPGLWNRAGARLIALGWVLAFTAFFVLMLGGVAGLSKVETDRWGGL